MMPYVVGRDVETQELIVGDRRNHGFFLRGSSDSEREIRDLIQAANNWIYAGNVFDQVITDDLTEPKESSK